jgi:hypothetical protein
MLLASALSVQIPVSASFFFFLFISPLAAILRAQKASKPTSIKKEKKGEGVRRRGRQKSPP